jgi:cell volume regulation protein A
VIAVVLLSAHHPQTNPVLIAGMVVYELVAGGVIGFAVGWLGARRLQQVALPASGLYPIAVVALAVVGYAAASLAHASGFLAVFVTGMLLGNARLPHRPATRSFAEGLAWLAQIGLFVMLGLLVTPSALEHQIWPAIAVGAVLLFLARPAAVAASMLPLRVPAFRRRGDRYGMTWREGAFLSWAGLRGAVPIVLATVPITSGVARSSQLLSLVFVLVVIFTLVQGPTLPMVARGLRLGAAGETADLGVETAPLEQLDADLLQLTIPPDSRLHGVELFELRLPPGSAVTLIVRDGVGFVPNPETQLRVGDALLIVATANTRLAAERRLRAVSRRGKLADWFGDRGEDRA